MDLTPELTEVSLVIQRYGEGKFLIGNHEYVGSILMSNEVQPLSATSFDALDLQSLAEALPQDTEIMLLGSGKTQAFLRPEMRQMFRDRGISIDCMDTGAACRTYNILMGEGRRVAAALIAV